MKGFEPWKIDSYGSGEVLNGKRNARDIWAVQQRGCCWDGWGLIRDEDQVVRALMEWKGPERFPSRLPWE